MQAAEASAEHRVMAARMLSMQRDLTAAKVAAAPDCTVHQFLATNQAVVCRWDPSLLKASAFWPLGWDDTLLKALSADHMGAV